jgi:hypothetical protein
MPATTPAPDLPDPLDAASVEIAPELYNREQEDEDQAQDVAEDARHRGTQSLQDSDHAEGNIGAVMPDDVPDLIDKMNEMVTSGHIDNGAFAGEPMHDDEEDYLGITDPEDDGEEAVAQIADGADEDYPSEEGDEHGNLP